LTSVISELVVILHSLNVFEVDTGVIGIFFTLYLLFLKEVV
jgi:hypothetical protein